MNDVGCATFNYFKEHKQLKTVLKIDLIENQILNSSIMSAEKHFMIMTGLLICR